MQPMPPSMSSISDELPVLSLQFLNGTYFGAETTNFTFSIEKSLKGEYIAKFVLTFGEFHDEIVVPATVSDGRVYIDSTPTIFVVNPDSLIDGNTIQLFQTENLTLSGTVLHESQTTTLIEDYQVISKVIDASYQQTDESGMFIVSPLLWFDSKTGVLTGAVAQITDVLLNKVGVSFIIGGRFELVDYSENLNFTIVNMSSPLWELVLIPVFIIVFILVVFFFYRSSKKKWKEKRKTYSNKLLKFRFMPRDTPGEIFI
jgi:uncharacterized membrane protein